MNENNVKKVSLDEAAGLIFLTPENAAFVKNGDFPSLTVTSGEEKKEYERVWLHLAFPFDLTDEFISVQDKDSEEIGLIRRLCDFDEETALLLKKELERKYFIPKIKRILSLRERRGFSYWKVETDVGVMELSLQDTYRSLTKVGTDRLFVTDIAGNRCEIESLAALDPKSRKKLELYL